MDRRLVYSPKNVHKVFAVSGGAQFRGSWGKMDQSAIGLDATSIFKPVLSWNDKNLMQLTCGQHVGEFCLDLLKLKEMWVKVPVNVIM